jgi:excisionase family DNA binding protein
MPCSNISIKDTRKNDEVFFIISPANWFPFVCKKLQTMAKEKETKERKWLAKKDATRYLSISQRTIENWVNQGIVRAYRLGGRVFFDQFELDEDILNSRSGCKI